MTKLLKIGFISLGLTIFSACGGDDKKETNGPSSDSCELAEGETIAMIAPTDGQSIVAGSEFVVKWKADADQFTGFVIKVSKDGGKSFELAVQESQHTDATGKGCLEWKWTPSTDLLIDGAANENVRVRVQDYSDAQLRATTGNITVKPAE